MEFNRLIPELSVSNIEKSLHFYTETLGFKVEYSRTEDKFYFLSLEGSQLMIKRSMTTGGRVSLNIRLGGG